MRLNKFPQPIGHIYFLQLLQTNLLPETIISQAQPEFICSNVEILN